MASLGAYPIKILTLAALADLEQDCEDLWTAKTRLRSAARKQIQRPTAQRQAQLAPRMSDFEALANPIFHNFKELVSAYAQLRHIFLLEHASQLISQSAHDTVLDTLVYQPRVHVCSYRPEFPSLVLAVNKFKISFTD